MYTRHTFDLKSELKFCIRNRKYNLNIGQTNKVKLAFHELEYEFFFKVVVFISIIRKML